MNGIKANAQIRVEQEVDLVLKDMELKLLGRPHEELLITTNSRYKHYKANEGRIIPENGLLFREHFGETDSVQNHQILISRQLVYEGFPSLNGEFRNHPEITKTIIAHREKF